MNIFIKTKKYLKNTLNLVKCCPSFAEYYTVTTKVGVRISDGFDISSTVEKTYEELAEFDGFAGAIVLDAKGNFYHKESHPSMVFASFDGTVFDVFD